MNRRQAKKKIKKACMYALINLDLGEKMLKKYKIKESK